MAPINCEKRQGCLKLDIGYCDDKFLSNFKFYKFSGKAFLLCLFITDPGFERYPMLILEDVLKIINNAFFEGNSISISRAIRFFLFLKTTKFLESVIS